MVARDSGEEEMGKCLSKATKLQLYKISSRYLMCCMVTMVNNIISYTFAKKVYLRRLYLLRGKQRRNSLWINLIVEKFLEEKNLYIEPCKMSIYLKDDYMIDERWKEDYEQKYRCNNILVNFWHNNGV